MAMTSLAIAAGVGAATGAAGYMESKSARKKNESAAAEAMRKQKLDEDRMKKQQQTQSALAEQRAGRQLRAGGRQGTVLAGNAMGAPAGQKTLLGG